MSIHSPWVPFAAALGLAAVLWFVFRSIFSLKGGLATQPGTDHIQPRAVARLTSIMALIGGCCAIAAGFAPRASAHTNWPWDILGVLLILFGGYIGSSHLWLDSEGMHYRSGLRPVTTLPWERLDHYEVRVINNRPITAYYYDFRTFDGTTISLSPASYNMRELLQKIRAHADIHQQPYRY